VVGSRPTLAEFAAAWLDELHGPLAPITLESYERGARLHLLPAVGDLRLDRLTPQRLQRLYADLAAAGVGARTIQLVHVFAHRLLRDAMRWGHVARNVADLVDRPQAAKPAKRALSPAEARRFVAALQGDPLEALCLLAVCTGLRQGELLALHWSDVDWEGTTLAVRRSLTRPIGAGFVEKDPKSPAGTRTLPLPAVALEALRRHRARQNEARLAAGPRWEDRDLVFCNSRGRPWERQNLYRRAWQPFLDRARVGRLTFHELRHSAATLLLGLGVPPHEVQGILGHADPRTTLGIYAHTVPEARREALERLGGLLSGESVTESVTECTDNSP